MKAFDMLKRANSTAPLQATAKSARAADLQELADAQLDAVAGGALGPISPIAPLGPVSSPVPLAGPTIALLSAVPVP